MQGKTHKEISELSREDLISLYDHENKNVQHGLNFIKEENWRRDADASSQRMETISRRMGWLTGVITILTVMILGFVIFSVVT